MPTRVIGGDDDRWSCRQHLERLMRDSANPPVKKNMVKMHATYFVLFERQRSDFFDGITGFLKENE